VKRLTVLTAISAVALAAWPAQALPVNNTERYSHGTAPAVVCAADLNVGGACFPITPGTDMVVLSIVPDDPQPGPYGTRPVAAAYRYFDAAGAPLPLPANSDQTLHGYSFCGHTWDYVPKGAASVQVEIMEQGDFFCTTSESGTISADMASTR
jgi:hypothetical protein